MAIQREEMTSPIFDLFEGKIEFSFFEGCYTVYWSRKNATQCILSGTSLERIALDMYVDYHCYAKMNQSVLDYIANAMHRRKVSMLLYGESCIRIFKGPYAKPWNYEIWDYDLAVEALDSGFLITQEDRVIFATTDIKALCDRLISECRG